MKVSALIQGLILGSRLHALRDHSGGIVHALLDEGWILELWELRSDEPKHEHLVLRKVLQRLEGPSTFRVVFKLIRPLVTEPLAHTSTYVVAVHVQLVEELHRNTIVPALTKVHAIPMNGISPSLTRRPVHAMTHLKFPLHRCMPTFMS